MHELIQRMMDEAGISAEQAAKALETVKTFVKEQFPMMAPAVDKLFDGGVNTNDPLG